MARNPEKQPESPDTRTPGSQMKRASDYGTHEPSLAPATKARDLIGKDLVLSDFTEIETKFGRCYKLECVDHTTGEQYVVFSRHKYVMRFLDEHLPRELCPLLFEFYYVQLEGGKAALCIR